MHDPMTVVCDIPNPFSWRKDYRDKWRMNTLLTIWHVDPESDGSDDSCGWSFPRLTRMQRDALKFMASEEAERPWFLACGEKSNPDPVQAETLLRGAYLCVARAIDVRVTWDEACCFASRYTHNDVDNFRSALCLLPGWHSNFSEDREKDRLYCATTFFFSVARNILRAHRPWWRHPRWHLHHWKVQVRPLQDFKRWAFSRCATCGKRFSWGYAPVSTSWEGDGPKWFKSEQHVHHHDCLNQSCGVGFEVKAA